MISNRDKLECAERELRLRSSVYPRWVRIKKMSQPQAWHEIEVMEAIVSDYRELVTMEDGQIEMFIETRHTTERGPR